jgi:hypothetical protein
VSHSQLLLAKSDNMKICNFILHWELCDTTNQVIFGLQYFKNVEIIIKHISEVSCIANSHVVLKHGNYVNFAS